MNPWLLLSSVCVAIALALWIPHVRLKRAVNRPFPPAWKSVLEENVEIYRRLPLPLRTQLHRLIRQFLHQKHFTGAAGLEITDEIRVTIAAEACMLVLNRSSGVYPGLRYIIVYPTDFIVERSRRDEAGVVESAAQDLLGESWHNGKVILAWDSVLRGARDFSDGHNVVLHEFAHQLDNENGSADGAPLLGSASSYRSWARVLSGEFAELQNDTRQGRRSLMDHYGATNPAEFFAVATETFFEKPRQMALHHAELFATLKEYYRTDPREWQDK
jgi:hypothetical protein